MINKAVTVLFRFYSGLHARITIWDPNILKQIQIKEFSTFSDRQVQYSDIYIL